jgi:hypothetical protein
VAVEENVAVACGSSVDCLSIINVSIVSVSSGSGSKSGSYSKITTDSKKVPALHSSENKSAKRNSNIA